jgi:5S rRNA maturation endonuclease (ribonuclease M5)
MNIKNEDLNYSKQCCDLSELYQFVNILNYESEIGSIIVVEGKRDLEALRSIGFDGDVVVFHNFRGIGEFVHNIAMRNRKVILLLDMDRKGKVLTSKILKHLNSSCQHDYLQTKRRLAQITRGRLKHIEDLKSFSKDPFFHWFLSNKIGSSANEDTIKGKADTD